jgi:hypothetical protein
MAERNDRLLRALAEQENLRRRAARERDEAVRFAAADPVKDLLPATGGKRDVGFYTRLACFAALVRSEWHRLASRSRLGSSVSTAISS